MLAFLGFVVQHNVTGKGPFENLLQHLSALSSFASLFSHHNPRERQYCNPSEREREMKMQTKKLFITIVSFLLYAPLFLSSPVPDPESVVEEVHKYESFIFFP
jgi:hypothetical protein